MELWASPGPCIVHGEGRPRRYSPIPVRYRVSATGVRRERVRESIRPCTDQLYFRFALSNGNRIISFFCRLRFSSNNCFTEWLEYVLCVSCSVDLHLARSWFYQHTIYLVAILINIFCY